MATNRQRLDFLLDQLSAAGTVTAKPMFGEYGIYCDGKIVALFCDNRLFVKPTPGGKAFAPNVDEAPPYPGAKSYLLIEEQVDDEEWLCELIRVTAGELPLPSPRAAKKRAIRRKT